MEKATLEKLLAQENANLLIGRIRAEKPATLALEGLKQYDPKQHKIKDKISRPDRLVNIPTGREVDGQPELAPTSVPTARISIPMQRFIIKQRASFAVGGKILLNADRSDSGVLRAVVKQWRVNKIHFKLKKIARRLMAETEVAVIFHSEKAQKKEDLRLRMRIVGPSTGDELFPVFDAADNLICFGRAYELGKRRIFDLYVEDKLLRYDTSSGAPVLTDEGKDELGYGGKLPVVYWKHEEPECEEVQDMIDALEEGQSNFFDTNKRIGDPILFLRGQAVNMPAAGEPGKVLEGDPESDAKFLSPADATSARKMEFQMLGDQIYSMTRTVKLDPESLKGLGIESGAAMDRILIAPHMAAKDMQDGEFGEGVQRMVNFLVHVCAHVWGTDKDLEVEPVFTLFRIDDAAERINIAMKANGGLPVVSQRESVEMAGVSKDAEKTLEEIQAQGGQQPTQRPEPQKAPAINLQKT